MSNRVYASLFYIVLIVASSWTVVTVAEALAREALTKLALAPSAKSRPTRVNVVLTSQKQVGFPQKAGDPVVPKAPAISAGELAKALDEAEHTDKQSKTMGVVVRPRVAGWVKRIPKRAIPEDQPRRAVSEESSGRIIMRALRADM
ncbi:hypothetical protein [Hyphomicrobium sp. 99]|uniref:hypothetical protein n=1 Tax=Hyphomicrobium sp. 99 TaxID=1163419 RepID=UPI0005F76E41|nr:hypothetical protein [Hyphomicrobium sp. 99]